MSKLSSLLYGGGGQDAEANMRQYWMPDDISLECYECTSKFTSFRRRHHCRYREESNKESSNMIIALLECVDKCSAANVVPHTYQVGASSLKQLCLDMNEVFVRQAYCARTLGDHQSVHTMSKVIPGQ